MVYLNLVNQETSQIKYKISKFPDGQQSVVIVSSFYSGTEEVVIESRMNSFKDLELIICATQCLRELGVEKISLYIPYCLGGRSDRKFVDGGVNYIKNVLAPIINSQKYNEVTILDAHSDVLEACIDKFNGVDNTVLVKFALTNIDNKDGANERTMIISPDAGALKKIYNVAKTFLIENVVTASKVRDVISGNILRTEVPTMNIDGVEQIVIIDDICDGGRTFIELAKEIKKQTDKPIYLIVTHGVFSGGFEMLSNVIDGIFCTNSIKDVNPETVKAQSRQSSSEFVKQLNIF
jgi:ribose-phosphate pyrophosphokinase